MIELFLLLLRLIPLHNLIFKMHYGIEIKDSI